MTRSFVWGTLLTLVAGVTEVACGFEITGIGITGPTDLWCPPCPVVGNYTITLTGTWDANDPAGPNGRRLYYHVDDYPNYDPQQEYSWRGPSTILVGGDEGPNQNSISWDVRRDGQSASFTATRSFKLWCIWCPDCRLRGPTGYAGNPANLNCNIIWEKQPGQFGWLMSSAGLPCVTLHCSCPEPTSLALVGLGGIVARLRKMKR